MKALRTIVVTASFLSALPGHVSAQVPDEDAGGRWDLPVAIADDIVARLNAPDAEVRNGDVNIAAGQVIARDLAVLDGSATIAGRIEGDLLVVNGSAVLLPGAVVTGEVIAVGGEAQTQEGSAVGGSITSYAQRLPYERSGGRVRLVRAPRNAGVAIDRDGSSDFLIATGKSYNRVEGMPIAFGPRLQTAGSNPFRLQALGIYRSEAGLRLEPDEMGYYVQADQFIGGHRAVSVGATLYSVIDPIEDWQLTDLESGLSTFLFHRDFRDHYERTGWSLFTDIEPRSAPMRIHLEALWESNETRQVGSPWSLFSNADAWREQPVVGEGDIAALLGEVNYDSRNSTWNPSTGFFARASLEKAFDVDLRQPDMVEGFSANDLVPVPGAEFGRFLHGLVDFRSYNRIDPQSRLNLRVVAGGSLAGEALPPQRQHALGGEGSLPGYSLFSSDCGARGRLVRRADAPGNENAYYPNYGCDAFALLQAEFRGKLSFRFRWDVGPWRDDDETSDRVWDFGWDMAPDWALFVDAGRGWAFDGRPDDATRVNVGAGVLLERIGLYFAVPVNGGTGANVFLRLGPRF